MSSASMIPIRQLLATAALAMAGWAGLAWADLAARPMPEPGANVPDAGSLRAGEPAAARPVGDGAGTSWAYCIDPGAPCLSDNPDAMPPLAGWMGPGDETREGAHAAVSAALAGLYAQAYVDGLKGVTKSGAFAYALWEADGGEGGQMGTTPFTRATDGQRGGAASAMHAQIDAYLTALNAIGWAQFNVSIPTSSSSTTYTTYTPSLAFANPEAPPPLRPGAAASAAAGGPPDPVIWLAAGLAGLALPGWAWWRWRKRKPERAHPP